MQDPADTQPGPDTDVDLSAEAASRFLAAAGLVVDSADGTRVTGHIDLGPDHHTPWGVVHGGVYTTAVESAASLGASLAVRDRGQFAVGVHNCDRFPAPGHLGPRRGYRRAPAAGPCPATVACHHHRRARQGARTRPAQAAERPASRHRPKLTSGAPPGGSAPGSVACSVQAAAGPAPSRAQFRRAAWLRRVLSSGWLRAQGSALVFTLAREHQLAGLTAP